jgi:uncharacterized membrane protein YqhA
MRMAEDKNDVRRVESCDAPVPCEGKMSNTRLIAVLPAVALLAMAVVLSVLTTIDLVRVVVEAVEGAISVTELSVEFVELTDVFLLAVVLYITALGLFRLFITSKLRLPHWLEFNDLDDLKERLVSVVVVMLGVYFLGEVMAGIDGQHLMYLGISISVVIAALTLFTKFVFHKSE